MWTFSAADLNSENGKTAPMGIIVEDYTGKPGGTYTDTVVFTSSVEDVPVLSPILNSGSTFEVSITHDRQGQGPNETYEYEITNNEGAFQITKCRYGNGLGFTNLNGYGTFTVEDDKATLSLGSYSFSFYISEGSYGGPSGWIFNSIKVNGVEVKDRLSKLK